jgi:hypothetical protein
VRRSQQVVCHGPTVDEQPRRGGRRSPPSAGRPLSDLIAGAIGIGTTSVTLIDQRIDECLSPVGVAEPGISGARTLIWRDNATRTDQRRPE